MKPIVPSEKPLPIDEITREELDRERERFIAAVQEGLADAEAGRLLESDEVKRLLDEEFGPLSE